MEESRPGEYMPVFENERGTFLFNSKDLCMIGHIPEMIEAGIDSFKVEGRMKTALYVAVVTRAYRKAIDDYRQDPEKYRGNLWWYQEEIGKCTNRQFTTRILFREAGRERPDLWKQHLPEELHLSGHRGEGDGGWQDTDRTEK